MKKTQFVLLILLIFFSFNLSAQNPQEIFLENLTAFENLQKDENASISLNMVYEAREFLIELTGISYEMEKSFDMPIFPPDKTLKEWRTWFELNKEKLYWDKKDKKVKAKKK